MLLKNCSPTLCCQLLLGRIKVIGQRRLNSTSTSSQEELNKFRQLANSWWNRNGELKALHTMNSLRVRLIQDGLINSGRLKSLKFPKPFEELELMDVGCGGGILSEPLSRLGAKVVGIDAVEESIEIAKSHNQNKLDINYICSTIEKFVEENPNYLFDAIVMSEVIEHVENPDLFIANAAKILKPNGSLFITTINRSRESWLAAIVAAEYLLNLVPRGTHQWEKFLTPQEIQAILEKHNLKTRLIHGMCYNPVTSTWSWTQQTNVNYALHAIKIPEK